MCMLAKNICIIKGPNKLSQVLMNMANIARIQIDLQNKMLINLRITA